jgi:hypothetical protein
MMKPNSIVYVLTTMLVLVVTVFFGAVRAGTGKQVQVVFSSGDKQVALLELYTSQGCSSCPPADRWLSSLKNQKELWADIVPLAFHVDYWDYIGWKDRYARAEFGQRQRRHANEGGLSTVYTPGLLLNGETWRGWSRGRLPKPSGVNAGELRLSIDDTRVKVFFSPAQLKQQNLVVNIAWLGFDLKSDVLAGENRGRRLANDFIVMDMTRLALQAEQGEYVASWNSPKPQLEAPRMAIAAWVATESSLKPLQAVGGWLERVAD